ncbi:MAG TPA: hypothetical protein VJ140_05240 [Actinomycetota bacterium]|nr:hypothetical protein [Actinomycetota bacterium]
MTIDHTPSEPEPEDRPADDEDVYSPSEEDEVAARLEALGYLG